MFHVFPACTQYGPGWVAGSAASNSSSCYRVVNRQVTFAKAERICGKMGASLVRIESYEENVFITSEYKPHVSLSV